MDKFKELLNEFIDQKILFKDFENEWFKLYLSSGLYDLLNNSETDFLDEIHEKIEYTSENPNQEERKYNWINHEEFLQWIKDFKAKNIKLWQ